MRVCIVRIYGLHSRTAECGEVRGSARAEDAASLTRKRRGRPESPSTGRPASGKGADGGATEEGGLRGGFQCRCSAFHAFHQARSCAGPQGEGAGRRSVERRGSDGCADCGARRSAGMAAGADRVLKPGLAPVPALPVVALHFEHDEGEHGEGDEVDGRVVQTLAPRGQVGGRQPRVLEARLHVDRGQRAGEGGVESRREVASSLPSTGSGESEERVRGRRGRGGGQRRRLGPGRRGGRREVCGQRRGRVCGVGGGQRRRERRLEGAARRRWRRRSEVGIGTPVAGLRRRRPGLGGRAERGPALGRGRWRRVDGFGDEGQRRAGRDEGEAARRRGGGKGAGSRGGRRRRRRRRSERGGSEEGAGGSAELECPSLAELGV